MKMKMRLRWLEFQKQLVSGTLAEHRPQTALLLSWLLNFTLGFVLSAVPLRGESAPFGIAAAARAGAGLSGLLCALGASCGYLLFFNVQEGLKSVSAVILVYAAAYATQELRLQKKVFFLPSIAAFFTLLTGFLGYYSSSADKNMVIPLAVNTLLAFGSTYFFREALSTEERMTEAAELRRGISVMILLSCVLMALSGAKLMETVSLGRTVSSILILAAAYRGGPLSGAGAGLLLGLAMDAASGAPAFYALSYAVSALIAGIFSRHGRLLFLLSYILCGALTVFLGIDGGLRTELLLENFAASALFLLLPGKALNAVGILLRSSASTTGEAGIRRYTARRLARLSGAFSDLFQTVDGTLSATSNDENITKVFDRAAERVCSRCKNKSQCWNSAYQETLNTFNDVTASIRERGMLLLADLPEQFTESCQMPEELVSAVNGELRGMTYRRQFRARLSENRRAAYQQYLEVAEILAGASEELENAYGPDLLAQRRLSRFLNSMDIDADLSVFRDRNGRLHILIESAKLKRMLQEPGYLDRISDAVGVRLCRPNGSDENCEGRITLMEAEPLTAAVGVASVKKAGETVSGDRGTYFKTEQGLLCVLLSDGMGSGESAARESVAAVRILERFLRTGVDPSVGMRILNSVMLLKNGDEWGFATVDLLCIDLFTGDSAFYKYGAAPSYVRAGKQIRRIRSDTLAAGLVSGEHSAPDIVKMHLHPGNIALIASDGVLAETDDAWLRSHLAGTETQDMKTLARETLQTAMKQYGCSDDMTVLAVRIEKRA